MLEDRDIFWFHCQPNGTPERMTDREGHIRWEGQNSAWGKLLHESIPQETGYAQNLRMQGQYLDRETGLHYNLFRYYDPDSARFTRQDPIGLAGGDKPLSVCAECVELGGTVRIKLFQRC